MKKLLVSDPSYQLPSSASQIFLNKKQLAISSKNPFNETFLQLKSPLPNLPPLQKRLEHLSDSRSQNLRRRKDEVRNLSLLTPCNAEVWQVQEDTYLQRLFHSTSVVFVEHPPHIALHRLLCHRLRGCSQISEPWVTLELLKGPSLRRWPPSWPKAA